MENQHYRPWEDLMPTEAPISRFFLSILFFRASLNFSLFLFCLLLLRAIGSPPYHRLSIYRCPVEIQISLFDRRQLS